MLWLQHYDMISFQAPRSGNAENGNGVPAKIQREFECEFDFATKTLANSSIFEQPDKEYFAANHINFNFMNCKSICLDK